MLRLEGFAHLLEGFTPILEGVTHNQKKYSFLLFASNLDLLLEIEAG